MKLVTFCIRLPACQFQIQFGRDIEALSNLVSQLDRKRIKGDAQVDLGLAVLQRVATCALSRNRPRQMRCAGSLRCGRSRGGMLRRCFFRRRREMHIICGRLVGTDVSHASLLEMIFLLISGIKKILVPALCRTYLCFRGENCVVLFSVLA